MIKTNRDTILKPLQAVTNIVERRHTLPILSNVLMEHNGQSLNLMATDLEMQVTTSSDCPADESLLALTVSARKLQDILRLLPEGSQVSLEASDNRLHVRAGRSHFNLQTLPATDFPRMAENAQGGAGFKLGQSTLRRLLALVQYAMAQQDIRYYLNGLLMIVESGILTVVATDGHRLALASTDIGQDIPRQEVILPRKAVVELVKLLAENDDPIRVDFLGNQVRICL